MESFTYTILFLMGIFLGSFFTLAVYRIPRGENILYKHSYCPNCYHKLGVLDLIPVFSYLVLRGKCRYCHDNVRIRYLLLEVLSGIVLVLYAYTSQFNILFADIAATIQFFFFVLYLAGIFIVAGIDKEKKVIQPSVLWYEIFVTLGYMIYICTLHKENAYIYIIYLSILIVTILLDVILLRKQAEPCYGTRMFILFMTMLLFNGIKSGIVTLGLTLGYFILYSMIETVKQKRHKFLQKEKEHIKPLQLGFVLCTSNIISILLIQWIEHYIY